MRIVLTDNNLAKNPDMAYDREQLSALFPISDKPISELCKENENLLVFPYSLGDMGDDIGNSPIFSIQNTPDKDKVVITTGNVMGFMGISNHQIKIKSRFDDDREDYFLHYMLQKVMRFNLVDMNHEIEQEDVFDLLMFMFPYFLRNALKQGVYREYQRFEHNDANIRGTINVASFIQKNTPFAGKIAYSTREYSHDNSMTQLIRHAIEYMSTKRFGKDVLNKDRDTKEDITCIVANTPSYDKSKRSSVIQKNLRHRRHPYYTEYAPLRSLCLQILRMEEVKYGEQDEEISGILFDGAWLWEEYVNTILCEQGFKHAENKLKKGAIYLFEDKDSLGHTLHSGKRYPDFYKKDMVLDAKYKRLGSYEKVAQIERDDIHQIITYMNALKAPQGGFVAPLVERQTIVPTSRLKDSSSTVSIFGIEIAKDLTYNDFVDIMEVNERAFVDSITSKAIDNR